MIKEVHSSVADLDVFSLKVTQMKSQDQPVEEGVSGSQFDVHEITLIQV